MPQDRLQPHHLADLRASGLSDDTIAKSGCYSAQEPTTRMLLGFGVGPGLVFPYPGVTPPFVQVKPDTALPGRKYVTPKDAGCRLYVPATLNGDTLHNPAVSLYVTEGAKKAMKATQEGLPCIALAGVDAWRDRTNGKSAPIADLDRVAWKGRSVFIVYDSDLAQKVPVQQAEFRLARELRSRGAVVHAIRLPDLTPGKKVGFDDYLLQHSAETFCALEPKAIHHPATAEAKKSRAEAPRVEALIRDGDDFRFAWDSLGVMVSMTRLRELPSGIEGEIAIAVSGRDLHWSRINLASLSAREGLVTKLGRTHGGLPWRDILEQVCRDVSVKLRSDNPATVLEPVQRTAEKYLVDKLLLDKETNLIFADGGSGKSTLALALAVSVASGRYLPCGLYPHGKGPVLYLDWETYKDPHQELLSDLIRLLDAKDHDPVYHKFMAGSLADEVTKVRAECARINPALIVVDSLVAASGMDPEGSDATIRTMNALRSLPGTKMVLTHVSKATADVNTPGRPYGSVFVMNLPRNTWEIRKSLESGDNTLTMGLFHRKSNRGHLLSPFSISFIYDNDSLVKIAHGDLSQDAALRERAGVRYSIRSALANGAQTITQLAEYIEATEDTVKKTLQRMLLAGQVVRMGDEKPAPGRPVLWGLKAE